MNAAAKFALDKGATQKETILYIASLGIFRRLGRPFFNRDLRVLDGTHRTNITQYLRRMVARGLLRKHGHDSYVPETANGAAAKAPKSRRKK